jgi:hypothetical protein
VSGRGKRRGEVRKRKERGGRRRGGKRRKTNDGETLKRNTDSVDISRQQSRWCGKLEASEAEKTKQLEEEKAVRGHATKRDRSSESRAVSRRRVEPTSKREISALDQLSSLSRRKEGREGDLRRRRWKLVPCSRRD